MTVTLNIKDRTRVPFFMELINSLDYVHVVENIKEKRKNQFINDLTEAFEDVKLHEQGKTKLKPLKEVLNEL